MLSNYWTSFITLVDKLDALIDKSTVIETLGVIKDISNAFSAFFDPKY